MRFARFAAPAIAGLILAAPAVALAQAQDYPTRPVTLVAPFARPDHHLFPKLGHFVGGDAKSRNIDAAMCPCVD
jgi:hypothetical protein